MADSETEDALAHSFLAELPAEVISELRVGGERADYPAGTTVYQPGSEPRAALVVCGLLRVFLASLEGRQVTVRYARPGDVLGIAVLVAARSASGCRRWSHRACSGSAPARFSPLPAAMPGCPGRSPGS